MRNENDWRRKYFETLDRLEAGERRWSALESRIRLLVGRLCLAAQGRDPRLDEQLRTLSESVRRALDPEQIDALLGPLSRAVAALDEHPDPIAQPRIGPAQADRVSAARDSVQHAFNAVLSRLARLPDIRPLIAELHERPSDEVGGDELAEALERVARHISEQRAQLNREKVEVEHLLQQVTSRLDEIAAHFEGDVLEQQAAKESTQRLNTLVMEEVNSLNTNAQRAVDLSELRQQVSARLDAIHSHLQEFRAREEARAESHHDKTERMRLRIAELERESRVLQQILQEEQRMAMIDALTGIPNRAAYDDRIELEFKRWKRHRHAISILAWDIDHFKAINDAYGHRAGDKVLRIIGQHLTKFLRETDFVARYGGEEFVMVLVGADTAQAYELANKIRVSIAEIGFHFRSQPVSVTASCGITGFHEQDTPDSVFDRADHALYRAKEAGRNCCVVA